MGLRDKLRAKMAEMAAPGGALDKQITKTFYLKAQSLKEQGKPVTEETLISGWHKLKVLGVDEDYARQKAREVLKNAD